MFNKKEMKKIRMDKVGKYLMEGETVFLLNSDNSLQEITADTDVEKIFYHNLLGGCFAVYRRKHLGSFHKRIQIGRWTVSVSRAEKGGDEDALFDAGQTR